MLVKTQNALFRTEDIICIENNDADNTGAKLVTLVHGKTILISPQESYRLLAFGEFAPVRSLISENAGLEERLRQVE